MRWEWRSGCGDDSGQCGMGTRIREGWFTEGRATFLDDNNNVVFACIAAVRGRWEIFGRERGLLQWLDLVSVTEWGGEFEGNNNMCGRVVEILNDGEIRAAEIKQKNIRGAKLVWKVKYMCSPLLNRVLNYPLQRSKWQSLQKQGGHEPIIKRSLGPQLRHIYVHVHSLVLIQSSSWFLFRSCEETS